MYAIARRVCASTVLLKQAARRRFPVLDVVPFDEEDESSFVGLLQVEAVLQQRISRVGERPLT